MHGNSVKAHRVSRHGLNITYTEEHGKPCSFFFLKATDSKSDMFAKAKDKVFIKAPKISVLGYLVFLQEIISCKARRISVLQFKVPNILWRDVPRGTSYFCKKRAVFHYTD